jgi:hypothetical protein
MFVVFNTITHPPYQLTHYVFFCGNVHYDCSEEGAEDDGGQEEEGRQEGGG